MSDARSSQDEPSPPEGSPPCPGCGNVGHSVQEWVGETQMWHCATDPDECRVQQYRPRDCDPQDSPGGALL